MGTAEIQIPPAILQKWLKITDLLAEIVQVPAALIMKIESPEIIVFVSSESKDNPYERSERACLNTGLYCETVMRTRQPLLVPDALNDEQWKANPDIKRGMISYLGFPISWPDGDIFGTICVLDDKKNSYRDIHHALLSQFRDVIETDLKSLVILDARLAEETRAKERLEEQVKERTAELARANAQLQRDLAGRRRAEEALRASQKLLQAIIDSSIAVIYVKDLHGRYVLINRHYEDLLHISREAIIGKSDHDMFPRECSEAYRAVDQRTLAAGRPLEVEERVPQDDGLHTYISLKFPLDDDAGVPYALCSISTDITERKRAEEDRIRLLQQEQQARAAAEAAVQMRDDFLSIASHELYTPVASLKFALQSMLRETRKTRAGPPKLLCLAEQQCRRLVKLIEDLLNVSRTQTGKVGLDLGEVDLLTLSQEVVGRFEAELEQAGIPVVWHVGGPVVGTWDRARIEQVVTNLVHNAIKYGAGKPIEVRVAAAGADARLVVADHGIGITPDHLPTIFERFARGVSAQHYGGLGLGLYITRDIVAAHGGSIQVQSEPGVGSVFTVEIPRQKNSQPSLLEVSPRPEGHDDYAEP